jgi:cytochrome c oxidase assembly protein subunit 15
MSLSEFKFIFYMEWAHRMLGRFIGVSFVLPAVYFASRGYMTRSTKIKSLAIAGMIGTQGLLGWMMVKSGLDDELMEKPFAVPRVNHLWLSAHLGSAFVIYTSLLITGLGIISPKLKLSNLPKYLKPTSMGVFGLVFLTAISGAWVAGLDAGLIYNEFPMMGGGLVPSDMWALSDDSKGAAAIPKWKNMIENPASVQFLHRVMVYVYNLGYYNIFNYLCLLACFTRPHFTKASAAGA